MHKKKISFQLLRTFLLSSMIPFIFCTLLISSIYSHNYTEDMQKLVSTSVISMSQNISTYLDGLKQVTLMPYYNDDIYFYINSFCNTTDLSLFEKIKMQRTLNSSFTFIRHSRNDTNGIFIMNPERCIYYTINNSDHVSLNTSYYYGEQIWYQQAVAANGRAILLGPHIPDYIYPVSKSPVISILRSIVKLETREPIGVIKIDVNTALFEKNFQTLDFHLASKIIVCDENNKILYSNSSLNEEEAVIAQTETGVLSLQDGSWKVFSYEIENTPWKIKVLLSNKELSQSIFTIYLVALFLYLISITAAVLLYRRSSSKIVVAVENMRNLFQLIQRGELSKRYTYKSDTELDTLGEALNVMIEQLEKQIEKEYIMTIKQKESEFAALQAQINPHFLFNTLNNFIALNQVGQHQKLEDSLYMLADLMRYILKAPPYVFLADELKFLKAYCSLQELRFDDRLRHEFQILADIRDISIPKLLLQPIIENSILHGCEPSRLVCTIRITISRQNSCLMICIFDDGVGFQTETLDLTESIGLNNVKKRLEIFSPQSTLHISSTPGKGTQVTFQIKNIFDEKKEQMR